MPDHRKPTLQQAGRADSSPLSGDLEFSIETTTMRLKSLKLRRAEAADKALDDHLRGAGSRDRVDVREAAARQEAPAAPGPVGRVRHDERGMAVWDWAAASGDTAALSATNVMRKLEVNGLSIEQTQRSLKAMEVAPPPARDSGGGDPYNQHRPSTGDPFRRNAAAGGNPYDRGAINTVGARRPPPAAPVKKPGNSVLDQLTGKKK